MTFVPHVTIGATTAFLLCKVGIAPCTPTLLVCSMIGAALPDIDTRRSYIGHLFWWISPFIQAAVGHRKMIHSPLFCLAIFAPFLFLANEGYLANKELCLPIILGLFIGYASHIFADWQTTGGIQLLWPHKRRFSAPWAFNTGSIFEVLILAVCVSVFMFNNIWGRFHV